LKKTTTIRLPEELATTVEIVARGRGVSVNSFVVDALSVAVESARHDREFMKRLREITQRDADIIERLARN
jgi:predicted transcriptional regulator